MSDLNLYSVAATILLSTLLFACSEQHSGSAEQPAIAEDALSTINRTPMKLTWEDLVPPGWDAEALLRDVDIDSLSDDDAAAEALMKRLREAWNHSPVIDKLDGLIAKLPGFVVPIEQDAEKISEFLLVPYYGACIHVPPPPSNQVVHVVVSEGAGEHYRGELYDAIWVSGTLRVERYASDLASAGYRIDATQLEPYDWEDDSGPF